MPTAWRTLVTSLVPMMWIEESSYQKKASLHSGLRVARGSAVPGTRLSQTSAAHQDPNNKSTHHSIVCNALLCDMWFQEHHCLLLDWAGGRRQLGGANGSNTGKWCRSETGSYGHCMQWSAA